MSQETWKTRVLFEGNYPVNDVPINYGDNLRSATLFIKNGLLIAEITITCSTPPSRFGPVTLIIERSAVSLRDSRLIFHETTGLIADTGFKVHRFRRIFDDSGNSTIKTVYETYNPQTGGLAERTVTKRDASTSQETFKGGYSFDITTGHLTFAEINVRKPEDGQCIGYLNIHPDDTTGGKPYKITKLDVNSITGAKNISYKSIAEFLGQR